MHLRHRFQSVLLLLSLVLLTACGNNTEDDSLTPAAKLIIQEAGAPTITGDMATDALNWFNFRRQQAGLRILLRNSVIDQAAKSHANYQQLNNVATHEETQGLPGFTGINPAARLRAAGYPLNSSGFSDGEVIAALNGNDGFAAAEGLIGAIYHRFTLLEPAFNEAGAGAASRFGGYNWLTVNLITNQNNASAGSMQIISWPTADQKNVRVNFFTDQEFPDPLPGTDEAGFPVSVHAEINAVLRVDSFTIRARGESPLAVKLLDQTTDVDTPASAAAIIPLSPLRPSTTYDVEFNGRINDQIVSRHWAFFTQ